VRGARGRALLGQTLREVTESRRGTDLARVAGALAQRGGPPEMLVLVSDLYDADWRKALDVLHLAGRDLRLVHLFDSADAQPAALGDVELVDAETGAVWRTTLTEKHAADYRHRFEAFLRAVRRWCEGRRVPCVQLDCRLSPAELVRRAVLAGK